MSYPRFQMARNFKHANSVAAGANQACSTSFASLFSSQLTLAIAAQVDDVIEMVLVCTTNDSDGQLLYVDFAVNGTRVGASVEGVYSHFMHDNLVFDHQALAWKTIVAGDLASGIVSVVPQVKNETGTKPSIMYNAPAARFILKNLGPADPT